MLKKKQLDLQHSEISSIDNLDFLYLIENQMCVFNYKITSFYNTQSRKMKQVTIMKASRKH